MRHIPVLLNEVLELLPCKPNQTVIDSTVGDAGHAEAILKATSPQGRLLAIDADPESLLRAKQYLYSFAERVTFLRGNFSELATIAREQGFEKVNAILIDLGWSSPQFAERGRGFSFLEDEPLDMRYAGNAVSDQEKNSSDHGAQTAAEILNTWTEEALATMLQKYGEEDLHQEIAKAVIEKRKEKIIERTSELVNIILEVYRKKLKTNNPIPWVGGLHPATKVFQALRIAVNHELEVIERVLPQAIALLAPGGRLAVITFHSLEDRIVKHYFKSQSGETIILVNKKPIVCGQEEYDTNPRARSAKLRVVEKI